MNMDARAIEFTTEPLELVGVFGLNGRLGQAVADELEFAGIRHFDASNVSKYLIKKADIIFECAGASALPDFLGLVQGYGRRVCIASSGHNSVHHTEIYKLAKQIPVLKIDNLSVGHDVQLQFVELLKKHNEFTDFRVVDRHPISKLDSPSGTAKKLAQKCHTENILVLREGRPVADHTVIASNNFESIEITHRVNSLRAAACAAKMAMAAFLQVIKPGLYDYKLGNCSQIKNSEKRSDKHA